MTVPGADVMAWGLLIWVPSLFVGVTYIFRRILSNGPLHPYVRPYSKHAPGEATFVGGVNWAGSGAGMRHTAPLARLTVRAHEIQLGPSARLVAVVMPTFVIPTDEVSVTTQTGRGMLPQRVRICTPHGDVEFLGVGGSAVSDVLRPNQ